MSSSQSDIETQPQPIRKPRKLKTKFLQLLNSQSEQSQTESQAHSCAQNTFYQKQTHKLDRQRKSNEAYNKFDRRMPIAITILEKFVGKTVRFNNDDQKQNLDSSKRSKQKKTKSKVGFKKMTSFDQKIQDEFQEYTNRTLQQSNTFLSSHITKTKNNSQKRKVGKGSTTRLKETTTPILSKTRKTHELKQIVRNRNIIRATWYLGRINGYAEIDYYDGGTFKGVFQSGQIISGQLNFGQGYLYNGQFVNFKFHGKGKFTFPQGHFFQGIWAQGDLVGKTTITYPKGQVYYGQVSDFRRHGQGYLYMNNHQKYCGQFYYGDLTGYGQYYIDGTITKKGFWVKGKYFGTKESEFKVKINQLKLIQRQARQPISKNIKQKCRRMSMFIPTESLALIRSQKYVLNESVQDQSLSEEDTSSFKRITSFG